MKNLKLIFAALGLVAFSVPLTIHNPLNAGKYSVGTQIRMQRNLFMDLQKAMAVTVLDPSTMNLSTVAGRADFVRFLYFAVVGTPADYSIPNGPEGGMVGVVQQIMGAQGFGGMLYQLGYTTCDSIPTTGSTTIEDGADTYVVTYATPSKTIPSHYGSHAGGSFSKSVSVTMNSANMLKAEFNCESASGLVSGYVRVDVLEEDRDLEVYFLRDAASQDGYLDFYMTYTGDTYTEKAAVQFKTLDDTNYDLFLFRNQDNTSGNDSGSAFGLNGNASTGLVKIHYIFDSDDATLNNSTAIGSGSSECIDLSTNTSSSGCSAIAAPSNVTLGAAYSWTVQSLTGLTLSSF